jgi:hypothetical protein
MFGLGKRDGDEAAVQADTRVQINFDDPDDLIFEADGRRYRLAWGDMTALVEKRKPEKKEIPFDAPAIEKYIRLERLLRHGLDLYRSAKLMGESSDSLRAFYGWCSSHPFARDSSVKVERDRQAGLDILKLVTPTKGPDGLHVEVRLIARDVATALQRNSGSAKEAARSMGVDAADLEKWLESNAEIMAALR